MDKKEWSAPVLSTLDFKDTMGGPSEGTTENAYDHDPVSGG